MARVLCIKVFRGIAAFIVGQPSDMQVFENPHVSGNKSDVLPRNTLR